MAYAFEVRGSESISLLANMCRNVGSELESQGAFIGSSIDYFETAARIDSQLDSGNEKVRVAFENEHDVVRLIAAHVALTKPFKGAYDLRDQYNIVSQKLAKNVKAAKAKNVDITIPVLPDTQLGDDSALFDAIAELDAPIEPKRRMFESRRSKFGAAGIALTGLLLSAAISKGGDVDALPFRGDSNATPPETAYCVETSTHSSTETLKGNAPLDTIPIDSELVQRAYSFEANLVDTTAKRLIESLKSATTTEDYEQIAQQSASHLGVELHYNSAYVWMEKAPLSHSERQAFLYSFILESARMNPDILRVLRINKIAVEPYIINNTNPDMPELHALLPYRFDEKDGVLHIQESGENGSLNDAIISIITEKVTKQMKDCYAEGVFSNDLKNSIKGQLGRVFYSPPIEATNWPSFVPMDFVKKYDTEFLNLTAARRDLEKLFFDDLTWDSPDAKAQLNEVLAVTSLAQPFLPKYLAEQMYDTFTRQSRDGIEGQIRALEERIYEARIVRALGNPNITTGNSDQLTRFEYTHRYGPTLSLPKVTVTLPNNESVVLAIDKENGAVYAVEHNALRSYLSLAQQADTLKYQTVNLKDFQQARDIFLASNGISSTDSSISITPANDMAVYSFTFSGDALRSKVKTLDLQQFINPNKA